MKETGKKNGGRSAARQNQGKRTSGTKTASTGSDRKETGAEAAGSHLLSEAVRAAGRRPAVAAIVWLGLSVLMVPLSGCPRFNSSYIVFVLYTLAFVAAELVFMKALYRDGRQGHYLAWKKFSGYAIVVNYVVESLPRVAWRNAGLIGDGRNIFLFALQAACLVAGCITFLLMSRPAALCAFGLLSEEEAADAALRRKNRSKHEKKGFWVNVLEWVDAIAFAAIVVILINLFLFQLYVIPSESMVPNFLIGDRPFTDKLSMGPRIPLTEWHLPALANPKRGDIVTISNPRYPENHQVSVKKQFAQFLFMITFTKVNIDTLPDGSQKSDPLVKRVVGVPGEKLMMIDDTLYSKTKDHDWQVVEDDQKWACTDIWKQSPNLTAKVQTLPLDQNGRQILTKWDNLKNASDPATLGAECVQSAASIASLAARLRNARLPVSGSNIAAMRDDAVAKTAELGALYLANQGAETEDVSLALAAIKSEAVISALRDYAASAAASASAACATAYEKSCRNLNLLIKLNALKRIETDLNLLAHGSDFNGLSSSADRSSLVRDEQELDIYLMAYYDARNFPEFPSGENRYLGPNEYFAMGDNRFNSLDFRFEETNERKLRPLYAGDAYSLRYASILAPFALEREFIEGRALFILWPFSRFGKI